MFNTYIVKGKKVAQEFDEISPKVGQVVEEKVFSQSRVKEVEKETFAIKKNIFFTHFSKKKYQVVDYF